VLAPPLQTLLPLCYKNKFIRISMYAQFCMQGRIRTPDGMRLQVYRGRESGSRKHPRRKAVSVQASKDPPNTDPTLSSTAESSVPRPAVPPPRTPDFADPVDIVQWGGELPSARRVTFGVLAATGLALGANFLGVTSFLLGKTPKLAETLGLDEVVPVQNFKRCIDRDNGYEYLYPAQWLVDQRIVLRNTERKRLNLDPLSSSQEDERKRRFKVAEPVSAYGPPAGSGEENVSVIVAPILPGFAFSSFGTPEVAAASLLSKFIAPEGSGKKATLIAAEEMVDGGYVYFDMEYTVETPKWARHNFAVFVVRDDLLYTFNAQASRAEWDALEVSKV